MEVQDYIESLPSSRREKIGFIRESIIKAIPNCFKEVVAAGSLIRYELPLEEYPNTYNKQPLMYLGLASRAAHETITLTAVFNDKNALEFLKKEFEKLNSKISLKSPCVKVKKITEQELKVICSAIKKVSRNKFVQNYERLMQ